MQENKLIYIFTEANTFVQHLFRSVSNPHHFTPTPNQGGRWEKGENLLKST